MKVKLIGFEHVNGISKTSKQPFDAQIVHFCYPATSENSVGTLVNSVYVDSVTFASAFSGAAPVTLVGASCNFDFDMRGKLAAIEILPQK